MRIHTKLLCLHAVICGCYAPRSVPDDPVLSEDRLEPLCTTNIAPGLIVEIRDARSGRWIADSASVLARDGSYVDTLRAGLVGQEGSMHERYGAQERPGTYAIEVRRPGYRAWRDSGVVVTRNPCHVNTVRLRADLEPDR